MLPAMAAKLRIVIVGPGRLGKALALALRQVGYTISEIVSRDRADSRRKGRALARKIGAHTRLVLHARSRDCRCVAPACLGG
jgi:predicted dinucleotide-binding enzyme